jgi:phage FluMu protein Com
MSIDRKRDEDFLDVAQAKALADMIVEPTTPELLRVRMINKFIEARSGGNFFATIFREGLSKGECPKCQHVNHWLVPEEELNQMGHVSHEEDERVERMTTADTCPRFQQACKKKKVTV